ARARVVVEPLHVDAVEVVLTAGEGLEQTRDVEEGGLARARRTGDGDELAVADVQVQRAQRVGFDEFGAVDLGDLAHVEHGVSSDCRCVPERIWSSSRRKPGSMLLLPLLAEADTGNVEVDPGFRRD